MCIVDVGNDTALEALGLGMLFLHGYAPMHRDRETQNQPSALRSGGLGHCLFITASCCHNAKFSTANSLSPAGKTRRNIENSSQELGGP